VLERHRERERGRERPCGAENLIISITAIEHDRTDDEPAESDEPSTSVRWIACVVNTPVDNASANSPQWP